MPSRGLLTAAALIAIALVCIATLRKLEREQRLLRRLRALPVGQTLLFDQLTEDERDAARALVRAGVVALAARRLTLKAAEARVFRRKRLRLAISGAFTALLLAGLVAFLILR